MSGLAPTETLLVIGASGFVGRHVARAARAAGYAVRCLARTPTKVSGLTAAGCEVVHAPPATRSNLNPRIPITTSVPP